MSDRLPAYIKVLDRTSATGSARWVLAAIASYAKPDGTGAWSSLASIRHRAGVESERTVQRRIKELVEAGELEVDYKAGPKGCNVYTVTCCAGDVDGQMSTSDPDTAMSRYPDTAMSTSPPPHLDIPSAAPRHSEPHTWTYGASHLDTAMSPEQEEQEEQEKREQDVPEGLPERDVQEDGKAKSAEEYVTPEQWAELRSRIRRGDVLKKVAG